MEGWLSGTQVVASAMAPSSTGVASSVVALGTWTEPLELHQPLVHCCPGTRSCLRFPSACSPVSHVWLHRWTGSGGRPTVVAMTAPWWGPSVDGRQGRAS